MSTPPSGNNQVPDPNHSAPIPPEERFWQRYSPHHEFPLSSVASVCLYGLGILLAWAVIVFAMKQHEDYAPLPVDTVTIEGGGGGNEQGVGTTAPGDLPIPKEAVGQKVDVSTPPSPVAREKPLESPTASPIQLPQPQGPNDRRITEEANQATIAFSQAAQDAKRKLLEQLGPGKGQGGSGRGGGKGSGQGTGEGSGAGPGKGKLTVRQRRAQRWVMNFRPRDVQDHLRQLAGLGAILAFPMPDGRYLVFRDLLSRPPHGKIEDVSKFNQIFWSDNTPRTVRALSEALGVRPTPPIYAAFMPLKLEEELLRKEQAYSGGRREEDLKETRFEVRPIGDGKYTIDVISQR